MSKIVNSYAVDARGIGAPDYSNTVDSARERRGLRLKYNQWLKMYGRSLNLGGDLEYPLVPSTPLAAGANTHLTDFETNTPLPIIIPQGYTLSLIAIGYTFSQDAQVYAYIDFGVVNVTCLATIEGGKSTYENKVLELTTEWFDPSGLVNHRLDIKIYNQGSNPLFGGIILDAILEAVGTPPLPTTKECQCPWCGGRQVESVHATEIKCKSCGKIYVVYDLTRFRETR